MKKSKTGYLLIPAIIIVFFLYCNKAFAQTKEEFDVVIFYVPQGMTSYKTTNNFTLKDMSGEGNYSITINRSVISLRKIEKTFPVFWKESMAMDGFDNPTGEPQFVKFTNNAGWDIFRGGKTVSYSTTQLSPPMYYHLTIIKHFGITMRIITKAATEEIFMQKMPLLMEFLASIDLKKQQSQPGQFNSPNTNSSNMANGNEVSHSKTSVPVETYALYMSVQGDLMTNAEISPLYFLPDGTVYTDIPEKGFSGFDVQEQKAKTPQMFGTYSNTDGKIILRMNGETNSVTYNLRPDRTLQLMNNQGIVYKKIEPLNSYRLEGAYIKKQESNNITLTFTQDGLFTDNGLIQSITANNQNNYPGSGNYSISKNSLFLNYSDGRTVQLCMYVIPEDFQQGSKPLKILVNNYVLTKI